MNEQLQDYARNELKKGLLRCSESQQNLFKRMYGKTEDDIETVVDQIPSGKLDWAMQQVSRTLAD